MYNCFSGYYRHNRYLSTFFPYTIKHNLKQIAFMYTDKFKTNTSWPKLCFPLLCFSLTGKIYSTGHKQDAAALFSWRSWNPECFSADDKEPAMQQNPAFPLQIMKKVNSFTHHFVFWPALLDQLGHWLLHQPLQGFPGIIAALMKLCERRQKFTLNISPFGNVSLQATHYLQANHLYESQLEWQYCAYNNV